MSGATGPSDEAVRVLHEEAQGHLEAVIAQIHEVDDKTAALVRFNAVIVGVVATGLSVAVRSAGGIIHPGWGVGILDCRLDRPRVLDVGGHQKLPEALGRGWG